MKQGPSFNNPERSPRVVPFKNMEGKSWNIPKPKPEVSAEVINFAEKHKERQEKEILKKIDEIEQGLATAQKNISQRIETQFAHGKDESRLALLQGFGDAIMEVQTQITALRGKLRQDRPGAEEDFQQLLADWHKIQDYLPTHSPSARKFIKEGKKKIG